MIKYYATLSAICAILFTSCETPNSFFTEDPAYLLYYGSEETSLGGVQFNAQLKAEKNSGDIFVQLRCSNKSGRTQELNLTQAVLNTGEHRSVPEDITREVVLLKPGEISVDTLTFRPINNRLLYQLAGLKGNLIQTYHFLPGGIIDEESEQKILFQAEASDHMAYLQSYGIDDLVELWTINDNDQQFEVRLASNIDAALNYSKTLELKQLSHAGHTHIQNPERPDYQVTSNEILMGGVVLGIQAYQLHDQLKISTRIVNHQSLALDLDLDNFKIVYHNEFISPADTDPDVNSNMKLQKGHREKIEITYNLKPEGEFLFVPDVRLSGMDRALFDSIPMIRFNLPKLEMAQED